MESERTDRWFVKLVDVGGRFEHPLEGIGQVGDDSVAVHLGGLDGSRMAVVVSSVAVVSLAVAGKGSHRHGDRGGPFGWKLEKAGGKCC